VSNERELIKVAGALESEKVQFKMFHEPWWEMGYSALATEPLVNPVKRLKRLKLWST
jgi:hypothetical protein